VTTSNFAVSHKDEKFSYRFSGSYTGQRGQVPNSSLNQGGLSFTTSHKLSNSLTLDGKFSYNKVNSPNFPRYGYGPRNHMYTILIWMGDDVKGSDLAAHQYIPGQEGYRQANFNYAWYNNVYFAANELNQSHDTDVLNGQIKLTWQLAKNLYLQGRTSAVRKDQFEDRASPKSYLNYGDPRDGDYKTWNSDWLTMDNDVLMTYRNQFSSNVNFALNAGAASFYHKYSQFYNATDGIIVPFVYSLNNTRGNVKASTYEMERAVRSVYATMDLDLMDAFYLTFAARNDWSSTLPESNSSYFYPSASLSTMVSNLVELPSFIDYLKLYGSWAEVSSDLSPYSISSYYNNAGSFGGSTMLTYPGGIINPDIKPEKSTSFELGTSASFINNRLSMDLTFYNILDENQIINLPISSASGFSNRKVNGNGYTTSGLEIVLNMNPVRKTNFRWDAVVNWDRRVTKLTDIYGGAEKFGNYSLNERIDNYYATGWMKTPDGELIVSQSTGLPTRDSYPQMHGHLEPDFRFGFQNRLKYKKFGIDIDFDGVYGGLMRSLTVEKMWWGGKHPNSVEYRDAEYAAGVPVYVPEAVNIISGELVRDVNGNIISDTRVYQENTTKVNWQTWCQNYPYRAQVTQEEDEQFANVFDRSFLKLRRLSISYDASELISIKGLKGIELTAYGYNMFILKKAIIIDPDFGNDNNLQDPSARYLGGSIKMTF
jgi:outer membrane receptor protein involved in Fe transport